MITFAELKEREAHRRLALLRTTIEDGNGARLRESARFTGLPLSVLRQWHASYLHGGFDALLPAWKPIRAILFSPKNIIGIENDLMEPLRLLQGYDKMKLGQREA